MHLNLSVRRGLGAVALLASAAAAGCSATETLLEVNDPDIILPGNVASAAAANALRLGAMARLNTATSGGESTFLLGGLLADEYRSADTFLQRNETDRRAIQTTNAQTTAAFRALHRARLSAEQAVPALQEWNAPAWQVAQMYVVQGFVENQLAEDFCGHLPFSTVKEGIEVLGTGISTSAALERALAHADSALALVASGTTAGDVQVRRTAQVLKGRILVNLERYADAAAAVAGVPTTHAFVMEHSANASTNAIWSLNNSIGRWTVSQGEGTNGIDFYTPRDPRVPTCVLPGKAGCNPDTPVSKPFDPATPTINGVRLIIQQKWPERYSPVAIVTGVEARLIEAEAALAAGNYPGALLILNDLRASGGVAGLTPLTAAATPDAQLDQLFRERAFWLFGTGHRLGDLRRLVRQYDRAPAAVYPTGAWWKGGQYGTDVNIPVPQAEENNPGFERAACVTTSA